MNKYHVIINNRSVIFYVGLLDLGFDLLKNIHYNFFLPSFSFFFWLLMCKMRCVRFKNQPVMLKGIAKIPFFVRNLPITVLLNLLYDILYQ